MKNESSLPRWWGVLLAVLVPVCALGTAPTSRYLSPVISELLPVLFLGLAVLAALAAGLRRKGLRGYLAGRTADFWLYLSLVVWGLGLSLVWIIGFGTPPVTLLGMNILLIPLFVQFLDPAPLRRFGPWLEWTVLLMAVLSSVFALLQVHGELTHEIGLFEVWFHGKHFGRMNGLSRSTLGLSGILGMAIPLILAIKPSRPAMRVMKPLGLLVALAGAIATQSRALWTALALAVAIAAVFQLKGGAWARNRRRILIGALVLAVAAGLAALVFASAFPDMAGKVWERLLSTVNFTTDQGNQIRASGWKTGLDAIARQPWGYGVGHTATAATYYHPDESAISNFESFELELVYGVGILGLAFFWPLVRSLRHLVVSGGSQAFGLCVLVITVLVQNFVAGSMSTPATLAMTFLAFRYLLVRVEDTPAPQAPA